MRRPFLVYFLKIAECPGIRERNPSDCGGEGNLGESPDGIVFLVFSADYVVLVGDSFEAGGADVRTHLVHHPVVVPIYRAGILGIEHMDVQGNAEAHIMQVESPWREVDQRLVESGIFNGNLEAVLGHGQRGQHRGLYIPVPDPEEGRAGALLVKHLVKAVQIIHEATVCAFVIHAVAPFLTIPVRHFVFIEGPGGFRICVQESVQFGNVAQGLSCGPEEEILEARVRPLLVGHTVRGFSLFCLFEHVALVGYFENRGVHPLGIQFHLVHHPIGIGHIMGVGSGNHIFDALLLGVLQVPPEDLNVLLDFVGSI